MKITSDIESINLSTGERAQRVVGDGESHLVTCCHVSHRRLGPQKETDEELRERDRALANLIKAAHAALERNTYMEFNPNHPVTQTVHDHWHKIVALLLHKFQRQIGTHVVISASDLEDLQRAYPGMPSVVMHVNTDGIRLYLVDQAEAERLAKKEGGLPI